MKQERKTPAGAPLVPDLGRPLTARSVVASTLLGMDPPRLSGRLLVRSGELFGISEGTTRVALSRMVAAGELAVDESAYELAGPLLERLARQTASRAAATRHWDGEWEAVVVVADRRPAADRTALRRAVAVLGLAALREGVWTRPANLDPERQPSARAVVRSQCRAFRLRPEEAGPAELAAELWDLTSWARTAYGLVAALDDGADELEHVGTDGLATAFVLAAAALRHLVADPLLPPSLVPQDWPGARLRAAYEQFDATFTRTWATWYRAQR